MGRHRREVHRRCRDGHLRRARRSRGRRRAGGAGRPPRRARGPGAERGRAGTRAGAPRGRDDGGGGRGARRPVGARRGHRDGRRGQHRGPPPDGRPGRRGGRRRGDLPDDPASRRLRGPPVRLGPGQGRAGPGVAGQGRPQPVWRRSCPDHAVAVHRAEPRAGAPEGHVRARGARGVGAARHGDRRAGGREEPPGARVPRLRRLAARAGALAAGPVPGLRGGHQLLGAG